MRIKELITETNRFHNVLKCSKGNAESYDHMRVKFDICAILWAKGIDFYTEACFKTGGRCDVLITDMAVAIEVLHSEDAQSFLKKSYPIPVVPINSKSIFRTILETVEDIIATNGTGASYYYKRFVQGHQKKICMKSDTCKLCSRTIGEHNKSKKKRLCSRCNPEY